MAKIVQVLTRPVIANKFSKEYDFYLQKCRSKVRDLDAIV